MKNINKIVIIIILQIISVYSIHSNTNNQYLNPIGHERLITVSKIWGTIKFLHPYLGYKDIKWDNALVNFLKTDFKLESDDEFRIHLQKMLDVLNDPVTKVLELERETENILQDKPIESSIYNLQPAGVLIIKLNKKSVINHFINDRNLFRGMTKKISNAKRIIFDLRTDDRFTNDSVTSFNYALHRSGLYRQLFSGTIESPNERYRMHWGYTPENSKAKRGFFSSFIIEEPTIFFGSRKKIEKPIVFLVSEKSIIPEIALALQKSNKAAIVIENNVDEANIVKTIKIPISDTHFVRIRTSELVNTDGQLGIHGATIVRQNRKYLKEDLALRKSIAFLNNLPFPKTTKIASISLPKVSKMSLNSTADFPAVEYRLYALIKTWNIIEYFFPYKELMERKWKDVLKEFIPKIINVKNETEYALAIAEMVTHLHDSHVDVYGEPISNFFGSAGQPFLCRMIENKVVITDIPVKEVAEKGEIMVGDIILKIDGEGVGSRLNRLSKYIPASTPQSKVHRILKKLFRGPENSILNITVQKESNKIRNVNLKRKKQYFWLRKAPNSDQIFKKISTDIGYADLDRLTSPMVDEMFETFKHTKAIIFDMRGYPNGTAWDIAPRLTRREPTVGTRIWGSLGIAPAWPEYSSTRFHYNQNIRKSKKWKYKGQTVMLIDERTMSQAEHTGLFFKAANNTKFIGSPTAGANGNLTRFYLPGFLVVSFTGKGIKHADGCQLQRKGLQPHIAAKPTIKGIREGKDEVLEKAIEYVSRNKTK